MIFNEEQLIEINKGERDKVDVSKYAKPEYTAIEMRYIREALLLGIDITELVNVGCDEKTLKESIDSYLNSEHFDEFLLQDHTLNQVEVIHYAINDGVDISEISITDTSAEQMMINLINSKHHVYFPEYDKLSLEELKMVKLGLDMGFNLVDYVSEGYSYDCIVELINCHRRGLDISIIADPKLTRAQMIALQMNHLNQAKGEDNE